MDANVSFIHTISPSLSSDPSFQVDTWLSQEGKLEHLHSSEACKMTHILRLGSSYLRSCEATLIWSLLLSTTSLNSFKLIMILRNKWNNPLAPTLSCT